MTFATWRGSAAYLQPRRHLRRQRRARGPRGGLRDHTLVDRARSEHADLLVQAAAQRRWPAVPLLVDLGFPLAMPDGTSALHHAAAGGDVETSNRLLGAGASPQLRDSLYCATPQEWATFFNQQEAADLLESAAR